MSTCIRDCDQKFMSAACASDTNCACAKTSVLQQVYACVQTTCSAEVSSLKSSIGNACGQAVLAAMIAPAAPQAQVAPSSSAPAPTPPSSTAVSQPSASSASPVVNASPSSASTAAQPAADSPAASQEAAEVPHTSAGSDTAAQIVIATPSKAQAAGTPQGSSLQNPSVAGVRQPSHIGLATSLGQSGNVPTPLSKGAFLSSSSSRFVIQPSSSSGLSQSIAGSTATATSSMKASRTAGAPQASSISGDGGSSSSDGSPSHGLATGPLAGAVVGALIALALAIFFGRKFYTSAQRKSRLEGRSRVVEPSVPDVPWQDFRSSSPPLEKESHGEKPIEGTAIQTIPRHGRQSPAEQSPVETPRSRLFSRFHSMAAPPPPPSMRSKRTSGTTNFTNLSTEVGTIETGFHTLDSQNQLAYPAKRPVSSTISFGTTRLDPTFRISWTPLAPTRSRTPPVPTPPQGLEETAGDESLFTTPSISRTSTMTDVSLGAVGRERRYIGRAL